MTVLSSLDLSLKYSKLEYEEYASKKTSSSRVSQYPLHYLVALSSCQSVQIYASKHKVCLKSRDAELHHLTPIMLAILLGKEKAAKGLAKQMDRESLSQRDQYGCTALHLASIFLPSLVEILGERSDCTLLTPCGGNYKDLLELTGHQEAESKMALNLTAVGDDQLTPSLSSQTAVSRLKILDETGSNIQTLDRRIRDRPLFDSLKGKKFLWQNQPTRSNCALVANYMFFKPRIEAYRSHPPALTIKPTPLLAKTAKPFGLFVDEPVTAYSQITVYGGRYGERCKNSDYCMGEFDAQNIGGPGSMANCGFPNAIIETMCTEGYLQYGFFAVRDLKAGEEILYSYGVYYATLVMGRQTLLGVNAMEHFFSTFNDQVKAFDEIKKKNSSGSSFEMSTYWIRAIFPLYFPNYLLHLWCKGITSAQFWLDAMNQEHALPIFKNSDEQEYLIKDPNNLKSFCQALVEIEKLESEQQAGIVPIFKEKIAAKIGMLTFFELFEGIMIFQEAFKDQMIDLANLTSFFETLWPIVKESVLKKCPPRLLPWMKQTLFPDINSNNISH